MKKRIVALYCRTSTAHQEKGLESQERALVKYCENNGISNYKLFSDFNYSGKLSSRPEFDKMIQLVLDEKVEMIITPNLSRVSRSLKSLLETMELLQNYNVEFLSLSESFKINSMHGRLMISILGAVSQMEAEMIAEKTRIGLMNARAKGVRLGREASIDRDAVIAMAEKGLSMREIANIQKCSPSSVCRILKKHRECLKPREV